MSKEIRKRRLDEAVTEYFQGGVEEGVFDGGGLIIGWTLAVAVSRIIDGDEADGLFVEQSPGMNNFMAAGLAVGASGVFENQMFNPVEDEEG